MELPVHDDLARTLTEVIHAGEPERLTRLLDRTPGLGAARIVTPDASFTLLHVATDWPGHFPCVRDTIFELTDHGADVNGRYAGPHTETPLHWAASSDDVDALDALLDRGADINATGAIIAGGTPLSDARAFGQWRAAARLVERGAETTLADEATLGLLDRLTARLTGPGRPGLDDLSRAFWGACHGGQLQAAIVLLEQGADINWIPPWEPLTPLDAAERSHREHGIDATALIAWLRQGGAVTAAQQ